MVIEQYEVLSPWAEADAVPLRGITPRLDNLAGKRIGLYTNSKVAAPIALNVLEQKLKDKYPTLTFTRFRHMPNMTVAETEERPNFEKWVADLDAVILAIGD